MLHSVFVRLYAKPRFGGAGGTAAFGFESLLSGAETETVQPLGGSGGAGSGPGSLQELLRPPWSAPSVGVGKECLSGSFGLNGLLRDL